MSIHEIAADDVVRSHEEGAQNERPPLLVLDPLLAFLDAVGLGDGEPEVQPVGDGHSNVTYLVTRGDAEFVVRRPPRGPLPPSAHDVLREARVLRGLEGRARVPRVLAVCPGATDTEFFDTAGESAAVGRKRSARQVVERTIRELSTGKPSFVDGAANVIAARLLNRITPRRLLIVATGRLMSKGR